MLTPRVNEADPVLEGVDGFMDELATRATPRSRGQEVLGSLRPKRTAPVASALRANAPATT